MIDLHSHSDQSDGTLSPHDLVKEAQRVQLEALAITDHDTFAGYDEVVAYAAQTSIELICGIEISTAYRGQSVHLLAYFIDRGPTDHFRRWIRSLEESRIKRNRVLAGLLGAHGMQISLEEVSARAGNIVARPHFAAIMVEKGYASSIQNAFDDYLGDTGSCFVPREETEFSTAVSMILSSGGLPVLPHPGRFTRIPEVLETELVRMRNLGLHGLEIYHSDHTETETARYSMLASKLGLAVTGGSDFHGSVKPRISLGSGIDGNVNVPKSVLNNLRNMQDYDAANL